MRFAAFARVSLKTMVWSSGVWMPAIEPPLAVLAPTMSPKYAPT
jgi:hypothetical protein